MLQFQLSQSSEGCCHAYRARTLLNEAMMDYRKPNIDHAAQRGLVAMWAALEDCRWEVSPHTPLHPAHPFTHQVRCLHGAGHFREILMVRISRWRENTSHEPCCRYIPPPAQKVHSKYCLSVCPRSKPADATAALSRLCSYWRMRQDQDIVA